MTAHVGASSAHKSISAAWVGASSAFKSISGGWVGSGGVWKRFFGSVAPGTVDLSFLEGQTYFDFGNVGIDPTPVRSSVSFADDGAVSVAYESQYAPGPGGVGSWLSSGTNDGLFEVRFTINSGSLGDQGFGSDGVWIPIDTLIPLVACGTSDDASSFIANITVEIRYNGGAPLASATFDISCSYAGD